MNVLKSSNIFYKITKLFLVICMLVSYNAFTVYADYKPEDEGKKLKEKTNATEVNDTLLKQININQNQIEKSGDLHYYGDYQGNSDNFHLVHFDKDKKYEIRYNNAFEMDKKSIDMVIAIKRNGEQPISTAVENLNYIYLVDDNVPKGDPNFGGDMKNNSVFLYSATANVEDPEHLYWLENKHVTVEYSFYDNETKEPVGVNCLVGLLDVDGSNYLFNNSIDRNIFYTVKSEEHGIPGDMTEKYEVFSTGIKRNDQEGAKAQQISYWNDAIFAIELRGDSTFSITFDVLSEKIKLPILYEMVKYNIDYELDGGVFESGNPNPKQYVAGEEKEVTVDPKKPGFTFKGWTRKDTTVSELQKKVVSTDRGDKIFVANWTPINYQLAYNPNEPADKKATGTMNNQDVTVRGDNPLSANAYALEGYKFKGWTSVGGVQEIIEYLPTATSVPITTDDIKDESGNVYPENTVVKTLYAQWEPIKYSVQYDPNTPSGKTATGTMTNQTDLIYDEDYNLNKNAYEIEGYEFLGWSTTPGVHDVTHTDEQGFKNLTAEDGGVVTMYAQWEPWKYNIYYNPNGGEGTMGPQTFRYTDESMPSLENTFTRNGYEFMGFEYQINGNKYLIKNPQEFKNILISLGKNGSVTLVAIWKEIPDPVVRTYSLPVTGVE